MNDDTPADDWERRVALRASDPATVELVQRFAAEADEYHPDEIYEAAAQRGDLVGHPVLAFAAGRSAEMAAEGPIDDLGAERAERLREPGRRLGEAGYRLGYSIFADAAAPVGGLDLDELDLIVEELDWSEIVPVLTLHVGSPLIDAELESVGEGPEGDAAGALWMAWEQGLAFAFAERLVQEAQLPG